MSVFTRKPRKTSLQKIEALTIEELLEGCRYHFLWNIEETKAILNKCSTPNHYLTLERAAFRASQRSDSNHNVTVPIEILDLTYKHATRCVAAVITDSDKPFEKQIAEIKDLHGMLGIVWIDRENSPERKMLQARLEVVWRKLIEERLADIKNNPSTTVQSYEKLFVLCAKDDPKILEIAEEINNLS